MSGIDGDFHLTDFYLCLDSSSELSDTLQCFLDFFLCFFDLCFQCFFFFHHEEDEESDSLELLELLYDLLLDFDFDYSL